MQDRLKVVCLHSPSHTEMLNRFFLPSFPKNNRIELKIVEAPQDAGEIPEFNSSDWKRFMHHKMNLLLEELLSTPENEFFLFLDVDIIIVQDFFDFLKKEMGGLDLFCQNDSISWFRPDYCTGVLALKNNERTKSVLLKTKEIFETTEIPNEQAALTHVIENRGMWGLEIDAAAAPSSHFFTFGSFGAHWTGQDFEIPPLDNLYFLHANYTTHENKPLLLQKFQEKLNEKRNKNL